MVGGRQVLEIPPDELLRVGVWEYVPETDTTDETYVAPVDSLPVSTLTNRVAAIETRRADGAGLITVLSGVELKNPRLTRLALSPSFLLPGEGWFHLARHFDSNYAEAGPVALAKALGAPIEAVFPISYDLRRLAIGEPSVLCGSIPSEPKERVTLKELLRLVLDSMPSN